MQRGRSCQDKKDSEHIAVNGGGWNFAFKYPFHSEPLNTKERGEIS